MGVEGRASKRSRRFTADAVNEIALATGLSPVDVEAKVERMTDDERLDVVAAICTRIHSALDEAPTRKKAGPLGVLTPRPEVQQVSLWDTETVQHRGSEPERDSSPSAPRQSVPPAGLIVTPPEIVEEMVRTALDLHRMDHIAFGDPALGSGIFFAVLVRCLEEAGRPISSADGVELDPNRGRAAMQRWSDYDLQVFAGDFLKSVPIRQWNFILANPPYVRSQIIDDDVKAELSSLVFRRLGIELSGRSNLFVYFLLLAHDWMADDGTAAWLLPADVLDSDYGRAVRNYLTSHVDLVAVHVFDSGGRSFENALVSSVVVFFRKSQPSDDRVQFSRGVSITQASTKRMVSKDSLISSSRWRQFSHPKRRSVDRDLLSLGDVFDVTRGVATGANDVFVLGERECRDLGLNGYGLRPLVPKSRYLPDDGIVRADDSGGPIVRKRLFLIDSCDPIDVLQERAPKLADYLSSVPEAVLDRYLVRRRSPFYCQDRRDNVQIFASSMGKYRGGRIPVNFYLNYSDATILNNYVALYLKGSGRSLIPREDMHFLVDLLREIEPTEYLYWGREFGGGLVKLEPGDLANVRLPISRDGLRGLPRRRRELFSVD